MRARRWIAGVLGFVGLSLGFTGKVLAQSTSPTVLVEAIGDNSRPLVNCLPFGVSQGYQSASI